MDITTILDQLSMSSDDEGLPVEALNASMTEWPAIYPHIEAIMDLFIGDPDALTDENNSLLFFGILMMTEAKHTAGLEKLLQVCAHNDDWDSNLESIFGDAITELTPTIFYHLAAGEHKLLNDYILGEHPSLYCRSGAIETVFAQHAEGKIDDELFNNILNKWITHFSQEKTELTAYILSSIANYCMDGNFNDYQPIFIKLAKEQRLDDEYASLKNVENWNVNTNTSPEASYHIQHHFKVVDELSKWHGFSKKNNAKTNVFDDLQNLREALKIQSNDSRLISNSTSTYTAPIKVGRNDPCSCGSGKKYKKCCML